VFFAAGGRRDDLKYRPLERLATLVESAGGTVRSARAVDVDLPHYLARFPRALIEGLPAGDRRRELLRRWDAADAQLARSGEDHPPVGIVVAERSGRGGI
jgi:hypothetical protein